MSYVLATDLGYLAAGLPLVAWVGRSLFREGEIVLTDAFGGDRRAARALDRLLVTGFCLVAGGYLGVTLHVAADPSTAGGAVTALSVKIGLLFFVVAAVQLLALYALGRVRASRTLEER